MWSGPRNSEQQARSYRCRARELVSEAYGASRTTPLHLEFPSHRAECSEYNQGPEGTKHDPHKAADGSVTRHRDSAWAGNELEGCSVDITQEREVTAREARQEMPQVTLETVRSSILAVLT
jgi:hypothetical protein